MADLGHVPRRWWRRWGLVNFIIETVWVVIRSRCPNAYGGIVRCGGQHRRIHRVPWDTIHRSGMANQSSQRLFTFYMPYVHLQVIELEAKNIWKVLAKVANKPESKNKGNHSIYLVIFTATCNEAFINTAEARMDRVCAGCQTTILTYFTLALQVPQM